MTLNIELPAFWLVVDSCVPGDVVVVSGGVKVNNTDEGQYVV